MDPGPRRDVRVPPCSGLAPPSPGVGTPPFPRRISSDAVPASPPARRYTVGRKECTVIISDDASISRVHAEIAVRPDGAARLRDLSKFGTKVDGRRVDKTAADGVPLLADDGARACRLTFGCAKPKPRSATLTREASDPEEDDDRTTDGEGGAAMAPDSPDEGAQEVPSAPAPAPAPARVDERRRSRELPSRPSDAARTPAADSPANVALARAAEDARRAAANAAASGDGAGREEDDDSGEGRAEAGTAPPPPAAPTRVEDVGAREGRATVVFEPLPNRAGTGTRARDDATTTTTTTRNFKKFRKTAHGPAGSRAGADTSSARRARRPAVAYADEAYDALHQWEDATVAAAHAAARADARTAEEMFETGNDVRAPARSRPAARKPRGAAAKGR